MGFDYTNDAQPLDSEEYLSNPLSDPYAHLVQRVNARLVNNLADKGDSAYLSQKGQKVPRGNNPNAYKLGCSSSSPSSLANSSANPEYNSGNSEHGMYEKAEDFIGGHVFFSDRGDLKVSNRSPFRSPDGTDGRGTRSKESLFEHTADDDELPENTQIFRINLNDLPPAEVEPRALHPEGDFAAFVSYPNEFSHWQYGGFCQTQQEAEELSREAQGKHPDRDHYIGYRTQDGYIRPVPKGRRFAYKESLADGTNDEDGLSYNTRRFLEGDCQEYAYALHERYPHLQFGVHETPGELINHVFTHDKNNAYDVLGQHPLPYDPPDKEAAVSMTGITEPLHSTYGLSRSDVDNSYGDPEPEALEAARQHIDNRDPLGEEPKTAAQNPSVMYHGGKDGTGVKYPSPEDFGHDWPDDVGCQSWAEKVNEFNPHLRLTYGFTGEPGEQPGQHAWNTTPDGQIVDGYYSAHPFMNHVDESKLEYREDPQNAFEGFYDDEDSPYGGSRHEGNLGDILRHKEENPRPVCLNCKSRKGFYQGKCLNCGYQIAGDGAKSVNDLVNDPQAWELDDGDGWANLTDEQYGMLGPVRQGKAYHKEAAMTRSQKLQLAQQLEELHGQPDTSEILHEFPDGFSIRKLKTIGDMNREGELMSNCWRKGFWQNPQNVQQWGDSYPEHQNLLAEQWDAPIGRKRGYASLRDPDNIPRASMYLYPWGPDGALGPHNAPLRPQWQNYIDQWQGAANGLAVSSSRKAPAYYRDEDHKPFHHHYLTGKRCYCPWGWNKLERWRRDTQREASEKVRMLRNQNRRIFRDEKGQAFLQHLDDLVNGKTYQLGEDREITKPPIPELDPLVPWLAHRYTKGDVHLDPGQEPHEGNWMRGRLPQLRWMAHHGVDAGATPESHPGFWRHIPLHYIKDWFHARQAPARRGVNIMDLTPYDVDRKVMEHQAWLEEQERREEWGDILNDTGTPVHHFDDGWHVRELTDPEEFQSEGKAMDHCLGDSDQQYMNGLENGRLKAFSLRDQDGWPHATWHINTSNNSLAHVQGRSGTPKDNYRQMISDFNEHMGYGDHPVGDQDYEDHEPEYDEYYDLPAADSVRSWSELHGSNSDPWSIAHEDDYANIGEDTELQHQEPEWDNIASDFLDYGPHATWENQGGRNMPNTHTVVERRRFMDDLHLKNHAATFDNALHENTFLEDPDHVEGLRIWNEASAPHRDLSGALVAPEFSWDYGEDYIPVTDPRHTQYQEPPAEQLPLFEASITTSGDFSSKGTTLVKTAATTNCRGCSQPTDNFVGRKCANCLGETFSYSLGEVCDTHGVPYQRNAMGRAWCPSCAREDLAANPRLRTLPSERAATRLPTFFDWYSNRGYNPTYSAPRIATTFSSELLDAGMPAALAFMAANHHVGRYVDALEAENPPEEDQQDNPE